jgi:hypothetical protein
VLPYLETGGSWRPFWLVAVALAVAGVLDRVLVGVDLSPLVWALAVVAVLGVAAMGVLSSRRVWTVRVDAPGPDAALTVGRERVPLADVDGAHLAAVGRGAAGVDAGAPVLGGAWSVPRGRTGLPLRLTDGRTVLVPTREPEALGRALLAALSPGANEVTDDGPTGRGTLGS